MTEIAGIPITSLEEPIHIVLERYAADTMEAVAFDAGKAGKLELTPAKPYSARSSSEVTYLGKTAGTLTVIAFAPEDGTGDEKTYNLDDLQIGSYPHQTGIVPRSKAALHSEVHLTIASFLPDSRGADPALFAGSLNLLGLRGLQVASLYRLGQPLGPYYLFTAGHYEAQPTVTATTGYVSDLLGLKESVKVDSRLARIGDPHAVFNDTPDIQVAAFLGITDESVAHNFGALRTLHTQVPPLRRPDVHILDPR